MGMDFVAFDFETADYQNSAPCSIGVTVVSDNKVVDNYYSLINPECEFSPYTIKVHGITPEMVSDSPRFCDIWPDIEHYFTDYPLVAHNFPFDYSVLQKVCERYGIELNAHGEHYCTQRLAKRSYALDSYKLNAVSEYCSVVLKQHHNASCDSCACAEIMIYMLTDTICEIITYEDMRTVKRYSSANSYVPKDYRELVYPSLEYDQVNIQFSGKTFICTGTIDGFTRDELYSYIESFGGSTGKSVTKATDYLIVGLEDIAAVKSEDGKSSKIKKAEQIREKGGSIKIITADDFLEAFHFQMGYIQDSESVCDNDEQAAKVPEFNKEMAQAILHELCPSLFRLDPRKVELNQYEEDAVSIIQEILPQDSEIILERRTHSYLTLCAGEGGDFCRIKASSRALWFSLDMWCVARKAVEDDSRFSIVNNKNQRHWKIPLSSIDDIRIYADYIELAYQCNSRIRRSSDSDTEVDEDV